MIKLLAKSLSEVPEIMKPFCTESEGVVTFDESKIKTEQDVQNVKSAKDKEVADHNATKAELSKYKAIGKTPEDLQSIADEYPTLKEGSKTNDEFLTEKKGRLAAERERDDFKSKFEKSNTEAEEYKKFKTKAMKSDKWKEVRDVLEKDGKDIDKCDIFYEDIEDQLELDEIGEFKEFRGKSVLDFFKNRAEKMGWVKTNTPGASNPGVKKIPATVKNSPSGLPGSESFFDDKTAAMLDG